MLRAQISLMAVQDGFPVTGLVTMEGVFDAGRTIPCQFDDPSMPWDCA